MRNEVNFRPFYVSIKDKIHLAKKRHQLSESVKNA